jgi:hypothetical protein
MTQTIGLSRDTIDKFYTKNSITKLCLDIIKHNLVIDKSSDLIIEPSAGNGAFIEIIKVLCNDYKLFDLRPENKQIIEQDYLKLDYKQFGNKKIHIIGNPPFGRQSSLAIKFIKYSALFCHSISFILPRSFKKYSLKNKIPLNFHCEYETDLPKNSFVLNGDDYDVPCIFQIWIKKDYNRAPFIKLKPIKYKIVKKNETHDISFRRVGGNAGHIDIKTADKNVQTHYFIKFDDGIFNNDLFSTIENLEFKESEYTVGPKSISQRELIKEFNRILSE